jgi:hypothetical protein
MPATFFDIGVEKMLQEFSWREDIVLRPFGGVRNGRSALRFEF